MNSEMGHSKSCKKIIWKIGEEEFTATLQIPKEYILVNEQRSKPQLIDD